MLLSTLQAVPGELVEHTETIRSFGPAVGGFILLILVSLLIKRKWPKVKTRGPEIGEFHTTMRQHTTATHATIQALHTEQQVTLRQAMTTIDRLALRDTGSSSKLPQDPSGTPQGGTP